MKEEIIKFKESNSSSKICLFIKQSYCIAKSAEKIQKVKFQKLQWQKMEE